MNADAHATTFREEYQDPDRRWELISTILMALATILTAWSGFQGAKWGGEMSIAFNKASAARTESAKASSESGQNFLIDLAAFTEWVRGTATGDQSYAEYHEDRFGDDLANAFNAWKSTQPSPGPTAASPFETDAYRDAADGRTDELEAEAESFAAEAIVSNQRSDNYTLLTVLFASVILFAGLAGQSSGRMTRILALSLAIGTLGVGAAFLIAFPVII